jgi:ATP-dependent DNA helicase RecG
MDQPDHASMPQPAYDHMSQPARKSASKPGLKPPTGTARAHDWQARPIGSLKGVGKVVTEKLARIGIRTVGDLICHYPRRYDDFSKILPIRLMRPGNVTFKGEIERVAGRYARARKLHLTEAIISDGTGTVKAIWFNQQYLAKTIPTGTPVLVSGELKFKNNDLALQSPAIELVEPGRITKDTARIVPVYPETEGLSSKQLRGLIQPLLPLVASTSETLPPEVVASAKLMPLEKALREIHFPSSMASLTKARHRLAFEELWYLMLASLVIKREIKTETAPVIRFNVEVAKAFVNALDFELTPHQKQAAWEIFQDMAKDQPMNRFARRRRGLRQNDCGDHERRYGHGRGIPGGHHGADRNPRPSARGQDGPALGRARIRVGADSWPPSRVRASGGSGSSGGRRGRCS